MSKSVKDHDDAAPRETAERTGAVKARPLFDPPIVKRATWDSFRKLNPITLMKNPVIFVVEVVSTVVTIRIVADIASGGHGIAFDTAIAIGLWFTVLFANFAEAMAEGRGKAQADTLRRTRADLVARRLLPEGGEEQVPASDLGKDDMVMVSRGRADPRRRRDRRGHRLGRRVGHHRRVGARDPGVGRRPLGGHRRHEGALGLDQGPDHPAARASRSSTG